jgi:hypothetical protein
VFNGTDIAGQAWQTLNLTSSSEDCLYVNVYAPVNATGLLPVLLYLHAGEFRFGTSNDAENNWWVLRCPHPQTRMHIPHTQHAHARTHHVRARIHRRRRLRACNAHPWLRRPYNFGGRVVLVTANVRLNIFGFAAHDALRGRDPDRSTGNYGMQAWPRRLAGRTSDEAQAGRWQGH